MKVFSDSDIASFRRIAERSLPCETLLDPGEGEVLIPGAFGADKSGTITADDVTCLIPFGGEHPHIFACLQSIAAQSVRPAEILIGLDYSGPPPQAPEELLGTVRFIDIPDAPIGPFKAMELLIQHAQTDLLMLQDSDDLAFPWRLEMQRSLLSERQLDGLGAAVVHFDDNHDVPRIGIFPADPRQALGKGGGHALLYPTLLMTQDGFRHSGGFDHVDSFGLDTEFVNRFAFRNRTANMCEPAYLKRLRETSLTQCVETGFGSSRRKAVDRYTRRSWQRQYAPHLWQRLVGRYLPANIRLR